MYKFTLSMMFAALMVLGSAAQAQDRCDRLGQSTEASLCRVYCRTLDCDSINDGDPFTAPQASENGCRNIAANFLAKLDGVKKTDVDPVEAMEVLDFGHCGRCRPPDCSN